jgi:hypothetical protein
MFKILSHGRWTDSDQQRMLHWLVAILLGTTLYCSTFVYGAWLPLRSKISELFFRVYLPWGVASLVIYGAMIRFSSDDAFQAAANSNIIISVVYIALIYFYARRLKRS